MSSLTLVPQKLVSINYFSVKLTKLSKFIKIKIYSLLKKYTNVLTNETKRLSNSVKKRAENYSFQRKSDDFPLFRPFYYSAKRNLLR